MLHAMVSVQHLSVRCYLSAIKRSSADYTALWLLQTGCMWCIEQDALMQSAVSGSTAGTPVSSPSDGGSISSCFHRPAWSASQGGSPFPSPVGVKSSRC